LNLEGSNNNSVSAGSSFIGADGSSCSQTFAPTEFVSESKNVGLNYGRVSFLPTRASLTISVGFKPAPSLMIVCALHEDIRDLSLFIEDHEEQVFRICWE
jgi:hypothetical protein